MSGPFSPRLQARSVVNEAILGLTDKDKVHLALSVLMNIKDPDAHAALRFGGRQITDLADRLEQRARHQDCEVA